ncbi:MAG: tetratricopeptide repeat protein [Natronospirillum sp.]
MKLSITRALILLLVALTLSACASRGPNSNAQTSAERYVEIGFRHLQFDNAAQARVAFREALGFNAQSAPAHLGLALVYQREGEPALAEDYFKQSMRMSSDTQNRHLYAQFLFRQNRIEEAQKELLTVVADTDFFDRAVAFEDLAIVSLYLDDKASAKTYFDRAITLNKMLPMPYWHMANLYLNEGDNRRAMAYFDGFQSLVSSELVTHTEESLILGVRVTEAMQRQDAYADLLGQLRERFPNSSYLRSN